MNRLFLVLFCMMTLSSCIKRGFADNILELKYINTTNSELFIVNFTTVGSDSVYCAPMDSVSLTFVNKVHYELPIIGPYTIDHGEYPQATVARIYNLSDTTIFIPRSDLTEIERDTIKSKFIFDFRKHIDILWITDNFISLLFKKDYTMLDKFKDHYSTESQAPL